MTLFFDLAALSSFAVGALSSSCGGTERITNPFETGFWWTARNWLSRSERKQ
jgi:hypothetical protein